MRLEEDADTSYEAMRAWWRVQGRALWRGWGRQYCETKRGRREFRETQPHVLPFSCYWFPSKKIEANAFY